MFNEKNIYEFLGIRIFQRMVFALEKVIHFLDHGKNRNYHFNLKRFDYPNDFKKFLVYNASIHIRNVIFLAMYFLIRLIVSMFGGNIVIYHIDYILLILLLKDLYCIMLQRYNYLRIQQYIEHKNTIRNRNINAYCALYEKFLCVDKETISKYYEVINKVIFAIEEKEIILFDDNDEKLLGELLDVVMGENI